jgi:hypothetical protein
MSKKIFKYNLDVGINRIELPEEAEITSVGYSMSTQQVHCWAIVDTDKPTKTRRIDVLGTGWEIDADISGFLGTVMTREEYVWHVFDMSGVAR